MAKRLKIVLGYSVVDEDKTSGEFFDFGLVYRDAPLDVLQSVHEVVAKHAPNIVEAFKPVSEELISLGYDAALSKGVDKEKLDFVKQKFPKEGGKGKGKGKGRQ